MTWRQISAYMTGEVNEHLLAQNEYLTEENRALHRQLSGRVLLSKPERRTLAIEAVALANLGYTVSERSNGITRNEWNQQQP